MRERAAAVWSFALVLLTGCQVPPPAPPSPPDEAALVTRLEARLQAIENQHHALLQRFAVGTDPSLAQAAGLEQTALLVRIAESLEGPRPAGQSDGTAQASDATARAKPLADQAVLRALQQALLVLEQQRSLLVENVANVAVPGYRRRSLRLSTELQQSTGIELPIARGLVTRQTTGAMQITERNLDVAIDGHGFYAVQPVAGPIAYTRNGAFLVSPDGLLVLGDGAVLQPPIRIPEDSLEVAIDPEGRVSVRTAGHPDRICQIGQIVLHAFVDADELEPIGGNLLQPRRADCRPRSGTPCDAGLGILKQGFLECSNVQLTEELLELGLVDRQLASLRLQMARLGVSAW